MRSDSAINEFALREQQFLASRQLLDEAERTLINFWGPTSSRSQVFALEAAGDLLSSSDQVLVGQLKIDDRQIALDAQYHNGRTLVERGLEVGTHPEIVFHPQAPTTIPLRLTPGKMLLPDQPQWPPGDWTSFLSGPDGRTVSRSVLISGIFPTQISLRSI